LKILALALACLSLATACTKTEKGNVITIGFNPAENADVVETNGKAFSEFYEKQTGARVKTFIATDYTALIEAMRGGQVDFAFLPAFSYVKAEEMAGAKVLMKAVRKGRPVLFSAIITRADRGISSVQQLKGKNIAWVDPASSSGFIIPRATLLLKEKIEADSFFGKQVYAGSHDALVLAVLNGTVHAGATFSNDPEGKDGSWHQYLKSPAEQQKIKMIYVSDPIPGDTLATTEKFDKAHPELVAKTVKLLGDMGNSDEGKALLKALYHIDSMVPAASAEYQGVRDAAKAVGIK
jgi:phosphonate transport system substrate-binding protein